MDNELAAIILAAGLGTRMRSGRAKVLHEIGGAPMIARVVRAVAGLDPAAIAIVVGHQADEVAEAARRACPDRELSFGVQSPQRGTGDAARFGLEALGARASSDILIINGDMPRMRVETLARLLDAHRRARADISLASVELEEPGAYGRVVRDAAGAVRAIVEARDASAAERAIREINAGVYIARAPVLREALARLRADNAQGEFYLTDIVAIARSMGRAVEAWRTAAVAEFAGINSREELAEMEAEIRRGTNQRLMAAGVTFIDPATAYIADEAEIGADTVIGPNVQIVGRCRIGAGVRIEGTAYLRDVEIGNGSFLKLGVRAEECHIGPDCEVGPFANLRLGTWLEGHNRIGNFVETKKARIGSGTKASHLSYLGDATIGSDTNIGCGVITVNYDGYDKHHTEIGSRCMVGCDTQLVAPVKVGDDVYIASGSTILREVPDGALAMSHHPQRQRPGWTAEWHRRHAGAKRDSHQD